jgi:hypothetical protein
MNKKFLYQVGNNKKVKYTNFSKFLFLEWNSTCFGQFHCPSSGVFSCTHSNSMCHTGLLTACKQDQDGTAFHIPLLCVQWKTPVDGQKNCPKHVEFHSKNKNLDKLVPPVGSVVRNKRIVFIEKAVHVFYWSSPFLAYQRILTVSKRPARYTFPMLHTTKTYLITRLWS